MNFKTNLKNAGLYGDSFFLNHINYSHTEPSECCLDGGGVTVIWHVNVTQKESYLDIELDSVESVSLVITDDNTGEDFDVEFIRPKPNDPFTMYVTQAGYNYSDQPEWTIDLKIEVENNQLQIQEIEIDFEKKTIELT